MPSINYNEALLSCKVQAYLILLNFALFLFQDIAFFVFLNKSKFCGNPVSSKSISAIFPTAFAYFMSMLHFDNSCDIPNFLIIIILVLWPMVFDVIIVIVLGSHEPCPCKMVNLFEKCCVCCDYSAEQLFSSCSSSLGFPIP